MILGVHEGDTCWQLRTPSHKSTHVVKVKIIAKDTVKSFYLVNFKTDSPVYP